MNLGFYFVEIRLFRQSKYHTIPKSTQLLTTPMARSKAKSPGYGACPRKVRPHHGGASSSAQPRFISMPLPPPSSLLLRNPTPSGCAAGEEDAPFPPWDRGPACNPEIPEGHRTFYPEAPLSAPGAAGAGGAVPDAVPRAVHGFTCHAGGRGSVPHGGVFGHQPPRSSRETRDHHAQRHDPCHARPRGLPLGLRRDSRAHAGAPRGARCPGVLGGGPLVLVDSRERGEGPNRCARLLLFFLVTITKLYSCASLLVAQFQVKC